MSARVRFLAWVREGLASAGAAPDVVTAPLPDRQEVTLTVQLTPAGSAGVHVRLLGPGDVTGIDPRQVIRTEPRPGTTDFEPNYFAAVELDRPELPWLFTPATEEAGRGRLRPWIALVVVPEDAPGVTLETRPGSPLPVLTAPRGQLPDPAEGWAWAHAQVTLTSDRESVGSVLADHPDRTLARVLSPRRLEPGRMYLACLVPAFEAGRRAGLGLDPAVTPTPDPGRGAGDYAWSRTPAADPCEPLPVYHHWRFGTAQAGDFESLVRRLGRLALPAGTGLRPMDVSRPGGGMPDGLPAAVLGMEGALRAPTTLPTPWPDAARDPFQAGLEEVLEGAGARLTPPVYGAVHAGVPRLPPEGGGWPWLRELNLDPRHRAAAALGVRIVQENQEALVAAAWREAAELRRANQVLRQGELARAAQSAVYDRRLAAPAAAAVRSGARAAAAAPPIAAGRLLQLGSPALPLIAADPETGEAVSEALAERPAAAASVSPAFRRIARPYGPVARRLAPPPPAQQPPPAPPPLADPVLALAAGELAPAPALRLPPGMVALDDVSSRVKLGGITPTRVQGAEAWWSWTRGDVPPAPPPTSGASSPASSPPAVVGDGSHVFVTAANGELYELSWDGARWHRHQHGAPAGALLSAQPPTPFLNERSVFLTARDGRLFERWWDGDRWLWREHGVPPGTGNFVHGPPGAVLRGSGIFMTGWDGHLWERRRESGSWRWYDHGRPSVYGFFVRPSAMGPNRLFLHNAEARVWERRWDGVRWSWTDHGKPRRWTSNGWVEEGASGQGLGIRQEKIFFRTQWGNLYELYFPASGPVWVYHGSPPGSLVHHEPFAVSNELTVDEGVMVTSVDGRLMARVYMRYGGWDWAQLASTIPGGYAARRPALIPGRGVVVTGGDGQLHLLRRQGGAWEALGEPGESRGAGSPAALPEPSLRWALPLGFMSSLIAAHVDNPAGDNRVHYRVGRDLDFDARAVGGWSEAREAFPGLGADTQGLGIAVGYVNGGTRPDLVVLHVDNPPGENRVWYRIGWELDADGRPASWSLPRRVPLPVSDEVQEADLALADLDGDGRPELVLAYVTKGPGWRKVFYRIGWRLDANGEVTGGWGESVEVPKMKRTVHGVGVAVADMDDDDTPDLVIFTLEAFSTGTVGRYRIGRKLNARGHVAGGWSGSRRVKGDPFPASHQGAGIAVADFSGSRRPDLVIFTVEDRAGENVGWYRIGRDLDDWGNARTWSESRPVPGWFGPMSQGAALTVADLDPQLVERRTLMGTRFKQAAARHQDRVLDAQRLARVEPPAAVAAGALAEQARAQMEPFAAVTERVGARVELDEEWRGAAAALRPLLAAPTFAQPMYEALRDLSQEHLFPGWDTVPPETVTLLRTNPTFVEAFLVGLNHEMARELLWREFPADRRSTFFRHFWDVRGAAATAGPLTDVPPIEGWGPERELGGSATAVGSADMLVLAIRGEVMRRYPTASVYARRARWDGDRRVLDGEVRLPQFHGRMEPDLLLFGMPLTVPQALGENGDPGWFFVIRQQPTEPRFGLDALPRQDPYGGTPSAWSALHWGHLAADRAGLEALTHAGAEASRLNGVRLRLREGLPLDPERSPVWGWNAAHMASITFQPPAQVAIHATDLVPREEAEWRVTGIAAAPGPERRIEALGGPRAGGGRWRLEVAEVIAALERGEKFYVEEPVGDRVEVVVSRTAAGRRYVKTTADGDEPNNLLALPRLPEER